MKTRTKALLLALCAVLLVVTTVFTTLAFLQASTKTLTNTFTIGLVDITLTETDLEGNKVDATKADDEATFADVTPGSTYKKDPKVTVQANSKDSYVFVKITDTTAGNIVWAKNDAWTKLDGVDGVYYLDHTHSKSDTPYYILKGDAVNVNGSVTVATKASNAGINGNGSLGTLTFQAYAIQKDDSIANAKAAWDIVSA